MTTTNLGLIFLSSATIGCSAVLAFQGKDGWGWFLIVGLLCAGSVHIEKA